LAILQLKLQTKPHLHIIRMASLKRRRFPDPQEISKSSFPKIIRRWISGLALECCG